MELGTGIAIAGIALSLAAVIFPFLPARKERITLTTNCSDHSGVIKMQESFEAWLTKIEEKLDRVIERRNYERSNS